MARLELMTRGGGLADEVEGEGGREVKDWARSDWYSGKPRSSHQTCWFVEAMNV